MKGFFYIDILAETEANKPFTLNAHVRLIGLHLY